MRYGIVPVSEPFRISNVRMERGIVPSRNDDCERGVAI